MKILVTGGAGFIGRHVVKELVNHQHEVTVVDCFLPAVHGGNSDWKSCELSLDKIECVRCTIGDDHWTQRLLKRQFDGLIHLASAVSVADSARFPQHYVEYNSLATARLCFWLVQFPVNRLVVASSMSVYGEGDPEGLTDEDWPTRPKSVYGFTKLDQEILCLLCGEQVGIPTMALRLFNVYGPGQSSSNRLTGVLANWAGAVLRGESPTVCEDGEQVRDFVYVADVARAFRIAVESEQVGVVNIGTGVSTSLTTVATMLATAFDSPDIQPIITGEKRPGDIRRCIASVDRAGRWLEWTPEIPLENGLVRLAQSFEQCRQ